MDDQQRTALKSRLAGVRAAFEQAEQSIDADDFDAGGKLLARACRLAVELETLFPTTGTAPGSGRRTVG